jgi:ComF family protein
MVGPDVPSAKRWWEAPWLQGLIELLLPALCLGCEESLPAFRVTLGLCGSCLARLPAAGEGGAHCAGCGRRLDAVAAPSGYLCGSCRKRPPAYDELVAPWLYAPPLDGVIKAMKFRRLDFLGDELGRWLAGASRIREGFAVDAVVPVPLHWRRHLGRGFNQAERMARAVSRELSVPMVRALERRRPTPAQSGLSRARRLRNLRRALRCPLPVTNWRILLVDDVITTGATLEAAARCLKVAGARWVGAAAVGRTPAPAERSREVGYPSTRREETLGGTSRILR